MDIVAIKFKGSHISEYKAGCLLGFSAVKSGGNLPRIQWSLLPSGDGSLIVLMVGAARTSEMLLNFYLTTHCYNPGDGHLHNH